MSFREPRDPARIDPIIEALRAAWHANPQMRLGQLVCNASRVATSNVDPFNCEDDPMQLGLGYWAAQGEDPGNEL